MWAEMFKVYLEMEIEGYFIEGFALSMLAGSDVNSDTCPWTDPEKIVSHVDGRIHVKLGLRGLIHLLLAVCITSQPILKPNM